MSLIVKVGKAGKRVVKKFLPEEKHHVSYTRRIERVKTRERVVAMTFDDGPMDLPSSPDKFDGKALTDILLDTLGSMEPRAPSTWWGTPVKTILTQLAKAARRTGAACGMTTTRTSTRTSGAARCTTSGCSAGCWTRGTR